jgi:hypothetical protein
MMRTVMLPLILSCRYWHVTLFIRLAFTSIIRVHLLVSINLFASVNATTTSRSLVAPTHPTFFFLVCTRVLCAPESDAHKKNFFSFLRGIQRFTTKYSPVVGFVPIGLPISSVHTYHVIPNQKKKKDNATLFSVAKN